MSRDWRTLAPEELLDKSETGYNDYISIHVKVCLPPSVSTPVSHTEQVFGLDQPVARSWTRRLKEYFELMCPGKSFPYYFTHRDHRGDITLGTLDSTREGIRCV